MEDISSINAKYFLTIFMSLNNANKDQVINWVESIDKQYDTSFKNSIEHTLLTYKIRGKRCSKEEDKLKFYFKLSNRGITITKFIEIPI